MTFSGGNAGVRIRRCPSTSKRTRPRRRPTSTSRPDSPIPSRASSSPRTSIWERLISALHASVTLRIAAGQPSYLAAGAQLTGSVYTGNGGLAFSASGYADAYVEGHYVGGIWFSFSTDTGSVFATLAELASQIAAWFRNMYGKGDVAIAGVLSRAGVTANQIASSLKTVYGDIDTQVAAVLTQIGTSATTDRHHAAGLFSDGDIAVASALNRAGVVHRQHGLCGACRVR